MKQFTLTEIIKIIPFAPEYRIDLSQRIVYADPSERYEIEKICWDAFWELDKQLVQVKYGEILSSIEKAENKYVLADAMKQAKRAVWQDYEDVVSGKKQELEQIDEIRAKLKELFKK